MAITPYDSDAFSPFLRALLQWLDPGVDPDGDEPSLAKIRDDMPAELKAILYVLAKGSTTANLGGWAIQGGYAETDLTEELAERELEVDLDPDKAVCLGYHFDHELSIWATWTDARSGLDIVTIPGEVKRWGSFEQFIRKMHELGMTSEGEMSDLDEIFGMARRAKQ